MHITRIRPIHYAESASPCQTRTRAAETRGLRNQVWLLVQENEVLRRAAYPSQANLPGRAVPARDGLAAAGISMTMGVIRW